MKVYILVRNSFCRNEVVSAHVTYTEALARSQEDTKEFRKKYPPVSIEVKHIIEERDL
jgi:hypothetical protein